MQFNKIKLNNKKGQIAIQHIIVFGFFMLLLIYLAPKISDLMDNTKDTSIVGFDNTFTGSIDEQFVGNDVVPGVTDKTAPQIYGTHFYKTIKLTEVEGGNLSKTFVNGVMDVKFKDESGVKFLNVYGPDNQLMSEFSKVGQGSSSLKATITKTGTYSLEVADRFYDKDIPDSFGNKRTYTTIFTDNLPLSISRQTKNGHPNFVLKSTDDKYNVNNIQVKHYANGTNEETIIKTETAINKSSHELLVDLHKKGNGKYVITFETVNQDKVIYEYTVTSYDPGLKETPSNIFGVIKMTPTNVNVLNAKWMTGNQTLNTVKSQGTPLSPNGNGFVNPTPVTSGTTITMYFETDEFEIIYHITTVFEFSHEGVMQPYLPGSHDPANEAQNTITRTLIKK